MTNRPLTTDRLRHEIDSGRTEDKIGHPDPAAAPLGTDDEAAGTPPSAEAVRIAFNHEVNADAPTSRPPIGAVGFFIAIVLGLVLFTLAIGWAFATIFREGA